MQPGQDRGSYLRLHRDQKARREPAALPEDGAMSDRDCPSSGILFKNDRKREDLSFKIKEHGAWQSARTDDQDIPL